MNISTAIADLMKEQDCVIVPGVGGFVSNRRCAKVDEAGDVFYPPMKEIGFNAQLVHNDGVLINYFAKYSDLDYAEAQVSVEEMTSQMMDDLEEEGEFSIQGLGTLVLDSSDTIVFKPQVSGNILSSSFGLKDFHFPKLDRSSKILEVDKAQRKTTFKISVSSSRLKHALIGVPVAALLAFVPLYKSPLLQSDNSEVSTQIVVESTISSSQSEQFSQISSLGLSSRTTFPVEKKEVVSSLPVSEKATPLVEEDDTVVVLDEIAEPKKEVYKPFVIVAGCFENNENANRLVEKVAKQGFFAEVKLLRNGLYRVALARFEDKDQALDMMSDTDLRNNFPSMWLAYDKK